MARSSGAVSPPPGRIDSGASRGTLAVAAGALPCDQQLPGFTQSLITQQVLDDELQSDHQPVLVVVSEAPKIYWNAFKETLPTTTPTRPIYSAAEVENLADELRDCIRGALESASRPSTHTHRVAYRPWQHI
ncbi:unnamed protein product [Arctia plantaginis]|uniref:Uncharacterized protein n=1 Tax=Arctia plantaginis TaxID=874455 RepID=A0A8S1A1N2_ARCPL|nr:unnamed protein product [Arctia plantaginis]